MGVGEALWPEEEPQGVQVRKPDVFDVALKIPEVFLEGLSPMVKTQAARRLPGSPLWGHHALASLADKATLCPHQLQAEEGTASLSAPGALARDGMRVPSLCIS